MRIGQLAVTYDVMVLHMALSISDVLCRKGKVQGKVNFPNDSGGLPPRRSFAFLRQHIPSRALTRVKEDLSSDRCRWKNILKGSND